MVQWDYDEEIRPLHGMYGSMEVECEVQRTIILCFLRKLCGPLNVHVDNKGIIDGLRKGEKNVSSQELEMQSCGSKIWEESHELVTRGWKWHM